MYLQATSLTVSHVCLQEVGGVPILPAHEKAGGADADGKGDAGTATSGTASDDNAKTDDALDDTPEALAPDKYLYTEVIKRPSSSTLEQLGEEEEGVPPEGEPQRQETEEAADRNIPRFTDNLAVYNSNKNTTDSGFYSVKEANSDSESGSEMKMDDVSPTQESSSTEAQEGTTRPKCNHSEQGICGGAAETGVRLAPEEEEEESVLERTMTADDFKESLEGGTDSVCADGGTDSVCAEGGTDSVCADGVDAKSESAGAPAGVGCGNGVSEVCMTAEREAFVQDSSKDSDSVAAPTENHVHAEKVDLQTANVEDPQQRDKAKKKKKKAKNKKNKPKHPEQELVPSENHASDSVNNISGVNSISSGSKSQKSRLDNGNPVTSGIPVSSSSSIEHATALASSASSSAHKTSVVEDAQVDNASSEPTTAASSEAGGKPTATVPATACCQLAREGSESGDGHDVYARVAAVKSKRSSATAAAAERCGKKDKESLRLNLEGVGSSRNMLEMPRRGSDNGSKSRENELLDSWGLSSILTRVLTPDDSRAVEGEDSDMRSPGDVIGSRSERQLTGDLPGSSLLKAVSDSVGDEEGFSGVGGSGQSNLRSSLRNGDIFWVIIFPAVFPNHTLCTVGSIVEDLVNVLQIFVSSCRLCCCSFAHEHT